LKLGFGFLLTIREFALEPLAIGCFSEDVYPLCGGERESERITSVPATL
jgi:hypothetical protein